MTGWICIDKPEGMTSFTAANRVRGILGLKKTGHTGTLDPMATGVLPIALSGTTRFIALLPVHDKAYTARVRLGLTTDTLDITGAVLSTSAVNITASEIETAAKSFLGESLQTPPMYSALRQNGVRLYELARRGENVERPQRKIQISDITVSDIDMAENEFTLTVACSAGTYIRSLADDIGKTLGCGAVLSALRRTSANGFELENCITLAELEHLRDENRVCEAVLKTDVPLAHYPAVSVTAAQGVRFSNGGSLLRARIGNPKTGYYRVYDPAQKFLGIGLVENDETDSLSVKRVFVDG